MGWQGLEASNAEAHTATRLPGRTRGVQSEALEGPFEGAERSTGPPDDLGRRDVSHQQPGLHEVAWHCRMPLPLPLWRWPVVAALVGTTALLGYMGSWATGILEVSPSFLRIGTQTCSRHLHSPPFPVHAFWHISHAKGDWEYIVRDQLVSMCRSGLLETTAVTATVLGGPIPRGVQSEGRIASTEGGSPGLFEFATLRKLQAYCEATPDARVLYFHNKGASYSRWGIKGRRVTNWRKLLEHFIFTLHRDVLYEALEHRGAAGSLYQTDPMPHFSGNFWGARCDYINTLPRIDTIDVSDRFMAEFWIGMGAGFEETNHTECFKSHTCGNLYRCVDLTYKVRTTC